MANFTTREQFEDHCQAAAWSQYVGEGAILCRVLGNQFLYVAAQDVSLTPCLITMGYWESWITLAIAKHLKRGMRCLDIGANCGYYTLLMAMRAGAENVIAIEPNHTLVTLLLRSLAANGYGAVQVLPVLAGESTLQFVPLAVPAYLWGGAQVCRGKLPPDTLLASVQPTSDAYQNDDVLHTYCDQVCVDDLDLIKERSLDLVKIDVEGYELEVWKGMQRTLDANPHLKIFMELTPCCHSESDLNQFLSDLEQRNITLRQVAFDGSIQPMSPDEIRGATDWLMLYLAQ